MVLALLETLVSKKTIMSDGRSNRPAMLSVSNLF